MTVLLHSLQPSPPVGPGCGSQRDEQRNSGGDRDLLPVRQPTSALSLHQTQLPAETQGKTSVIDTFGK